MKLPDFLTPNEKYISTITHDIAKVLGKEVAICFVSGVRWQGRCIKYEGCKLQLIEYSREKVNSYPNIALFNLAVHESCHLKYNDHSKRFRNLCRKFGVTEDYWLYSTTKRTQRPDYLPPTE